MLEVTEDDRQRAIMRSRRMYETDRMSEQLTFKNQGRAEIIKLLRSGVSLDEVERRFKL